MHHRGDHPNPRCSLPGYLTALREDINVMLSLYFFIKTIIMDENRRLGVFTV